LQRASQLGLRYHGWIDTYISACKPLDIDASRFSDGAEASAEVLAGSSLTTDEVCEAFKDVGLTSLAWRMTLTKNRPAWLMECRASCGKQGATPLQARWFPLKIATALVQGKARAAGSVPVAKLDAAFRHSSCLKQFGAAWKALREDNPAWGD
jgi:hypothetical protein